MNCKIRVADINDIEKIIKIYKPYVEETPITFEYFVPDYNEFLRRMNYVQKQFPWLVLEYNNEVAAYAYASYFHERDAYQWDAELSIYVSEGFRGKQIGTILYRVLIKLLEIQGYYNLYALLVYPNKHSEKLHLSFGFQKIAIYRNTGNKFGKWYDVLCMEKQLKSHDNNPIPPIAFPYLDDAKVNSILNNYQNL